MLYKCGILKNKVATREFFTDELIAEISGFDRANIVAQAKAYKPH